MPKFLLQQISFTIFRLSFYTLATVIAFLMVFGTAGAIKHSFVRTDAYNRFIDSFFAAQNQQATQADGSIPLDDPEVEKIIRQSFPADTLQHDMELVVDSTYAWLNGRTTEPDFIVDFTPNVEYLADHLSNYAMTRLQSLPLCETPPEQIDPFTATCEPEFFDFARSQTEFKEAIKANNGIVPKTLYTINDLPRTTEGKRVVDQYAYVPEVFQAARYAPGILVGTTLLSGLNIVYLARRKREAIRWLGTNAASSGMFIVASPLFYIYVFPRFFPGLSAGHSTDASAVFGEVIGRLTTDFNTSLILVGIVMALAGAAVITLERGTRPKSKYIGIKEKAGLKSSERPIPHGKRGKGALAATDVPLQTSEGKRPSGKYQKDKSYRTIHAKEY